jgi:hypothetical protein
LADEDFLTGGFDQFEDRLCVGEIVDEGLCADDVFAGFESGFYVGGVEFIGSVDADDVYFLIG